MDALEFPDGFDKVIARDSGVLQGSFMNTDQQKNVKPGLNFTTNTLGLLFRLTKTLEKRQKFKSYQVFDESTQLLKNLFGPHIVKDGVLSIHN